MIVFLTVCVRQRRPLLANAEAVSLIVEAWRLADRWAVGRYVIMPNHVHLFCAPAVVPMHPLKTWVGFWKNQVTRRWPREDATPIWQTEFWDRQLRRGESYAEKWDYVVNNPVRHGLVKEAADWPYQGEMNVLEWHD